MTPRRIAILGSTGSIGRQALEVIASLDGLEVCALAARGNWRLLGEQARRLAPKFLALTDPQAAEKLTPELPETTKLLSGEDAMCRLVRQAAPDVLLVGVVGACGLGPTLAGIECGATLAIANKETLVMAGAIIMPAAREAGVAVVPVDSEHAAIFQCLAAGERKDVRRVTITSSGGALRDRDDEQVADATVADTLNHPTWRMGKKITIDSATLMNKALEVVEAHWLFDLEAEQIEVVLHGESVVHACVEFCDGSVVAQLASPDMALPIAQALCWPERPVRRAQRLDLVSLRQLSFHPLIERFDRAVDLGYQVIRRGGLAGAVLNSANEAAVEAFCRERIRFGRIVPIVEEILARTPKTDVVDLESLIGADKWARRQVQRAVDSPPASAESTTDTAVRPGPATRRGRPSAK